MIINPLNIENKKQDFNKDIVNNKSKIINKICTEILKNKKINSEGNNSDIKIIKNNAEKILYEEYNLKEEDVQDIVQNIIYKIYGYGILEKYINDKAVTDIRAVNHSSIYIKKRGNWEKTTDEFSNKDEFVEFVKFCAIRNGEILNFEKPICIFSDKKRNLRIEAGLEPVNILGASLVVRIHRRNANYSLNFLMQKYNLLNREQLHKIKKSIKQKETIIICGKGASGKTTLLKAIINEIPNNFSITSNEETAELFLEGKNAIQRECILNRDEYSNIELDELTRHAMVMSTDIMVIGEIKSKEASSFLDAISTGHIGYATVHANSTREALSRIITLIKKDPKCVYYTEEFLKKILIASINKIIFMKDFKIQEIYDVKEQLK